MSDVAYITNAAATLTFTAGSKTVTVTGTNPILESVVRGDKAVDPSGMELAIDVVAAGTLTLLRNAPTSGTVQFDIAPTSRLRTSLAANAEVTREVYARLRAAVEDNRSIPVISLATAPPGSPAEGDRHLVIATATGAFAGKEGYIAQYDAANTRYLFIAPIAGMKVTVDGSAVLRIYTGAAWTISGATAASEVAFTPTGGVAATDVQTAIAEVDSEKVPLTYLDTDGTLAANSDTKVATQKAAKTYADTKVTKASGTTAGRLWRFTDTAGGLGQSIMSEDGSGNIAWGASGGRGSLTSTGFRHGDANAPLAQFDASAANVTQTASVSFSARGRPNAFEWGHGNGSGYANTFGFFSSSGQPYIVFNGEAGSTVINTIRTRGVLARGIIGDNAGGMAWFTVANANADDQTVLTDMKLSASGRLVIGASTDTARLDVNGDVAHRMSSLTVANGANQNVSRPAFSSLRISAPTAAFNLGGLTGGADGIEVELINTTAHQMTLNNEDASSTAGNRITTDTGGNLNCKHAVLRYDATASRWRVISFRT